MTGMYLEHYGVLGMKWGVRRTPEQLRHRSNSSVEKWKKKQTKKINSKYKKVQKELNKAEAVDPSDPRIAKNRKKLNSQHQTELKRVNSMRYLDVQNVKKREKKARKEALNKWAREEGYDIVTDSLKIGALAVTALSTGYTASVVGLVGDVGKSAMRYLYSPDGQDMIRKGQGIVDTLLKGR